MPANIMMDWSALAPKRDFYESFINPLLMGQELTKQKLANEQAQIQNKFLPQNLEAALMQQQLTNQGLQAELPFKAPTAEAAMMAQLINNKQEQMKYEQQPELFAYEQALRAAQAQHASASAGHLGSETMLNQFRMQNPLTLMNNDTAAAMYMMGQSQANPFAGSQQSGGAMPNASAPIEQNAIDELNQISGTSFPQINNPALLRLGYDPQGQANIELSNQNKIKNRDVFYKELQDASALKAQNQQVKYNLDGLYENYLGAIATGPLGSKFAQFDPKAQAVEMFSNTLVPLIGQTLKANNMTDSFLEGVAKSKPNVALHEETMEQAYNHMSSAITRGDQRANFFTMAQNKQIAPIFHEQIWGQFQEDYPLTGNQEQDMKTLSILGKYYTDPNYVLPIVKGEYVPMGSRTLDQIEEDQFSALPAKIQEKIIANSKSKAK